MRQVAGSGAGFAGEALPIGRSRTRRLVRALEALEDLPRGVGTAGAIAFVALTVGYGIVEGGHGPAVLDAVTARSGFTIDAVRMTGHRETSDSGILAALSIEPGSSLIAFDVAAARERVLTLPWIETTTIQKLYPDTIDVTVTEKAAFARWFDGTATFLIARDGALITDEPVVVADYAGLPLVAGRGAPDKAEAFLALLDAVPGLKPRVKASVRVGDRRWDLVLDSGLTIRLPEDDPAAAIAEVAHLDATGGLLGRDIVAVDLRLADRMVVRLDKKAAERRRAELAKKPARKGAAT
jgi:cell division protein FtsQ